MTVSPETTRDPDYYNDISLSQNSLYGAAHVCTDETCSHPRGGNYIFKVGDCIYMHMWVSSSLYHIANFEVTEIKISKGENGMQNDTSESPNPIFNYVKGGNLSRAEKERVDALGGFQFNLHQYADVPIAFNPVRAKAAAAMTWEMILSREIFQVNSSAEFWKITLLVSVRYLLENTEGYYPPFFVSSAFDFEIDHILALVPFRCTSDDDSWGVEIGHYAALRCQSGENLYMRYCDVMGWNDTKNIDLCTYTPLSHGEIFEEDEIDTCWSCNISIGLSIVVLCIIVCYWLSYYDRYRRNKRVLWQGRKYRLTAKDAVLSHALKLVGLTRFASEFIENGWDDPRQFPCMKDCDLKECGLCSGHIQKFRRKYPDPEDGVTTDNETATSPWSLTDGSSSTITLYE